MQRRKFQILQWVKWAVCMFFQFVRASASHVFDVLHLPAQRTALFSRMLSVQQRLRRGHAGKGGTKLDGRVIFYFYTTTTRSRNYYPHAHVRVVDFAGVSSIHMLVLHPKSTK